MSNIIVERLIQMQIEVSPNNIAAFEVSIGKNSGYLNIMKKRNSYPSSDLIKKTIEKYPNYSLYWILGLSDEKFVEKEENIIKEPDAIYKNEGMVSDIQLLRKGQELIIQQNTEILDKLDGEALRHIISSEKERIQQTKTTKKQRNKH